MNLKQLALAAAASTVLFAANADAQRVDIGFTRVFRHGSISVGIGDLFGRGCEHREAHAYRVWQPGHYECRDESVWVAGACRRVWVDPIYAWRTDYRGCRFQVLVRDGYWESVQDPGHYETRRVQVWVEGRWTTP